MTGVVIVRERDAKTDPPEHEWDVLTDRGFAYHGNGSWWRLDPNTCRDVRVAPQPSVWFDFPRDTERATLTVMALKRLYNAACHKHERASIDDLISLGAALDALDTRNGDNGGQSN